MARQLEITYEFRPPQWRPPHQMNYQTGGLVLATVLWLLVYGWLGLRLLARGEPSLGWVELALALVSIVAGVGLVIGWRTTLRRWARRLRRGAWPALDQAALYKLTPAQFEEYVAKRLFARHGYRVENTPDSRDGGVDIIVVDGNGRRAVVQCKRYLGTVGASAVRDLYGTMLHNEAAMGYLVTTGRISDDAREWANGKPLVLIDGEKLVKLSRSEPEPATHHHSH